MIGLRRIDVDGEDQYVVFARSFAAAKRKIERYVNSLVYPLPFISAFGAYISAHSVEDLTRQPEVSALVPVGAARICLDSARFAVGADESTAKLPGATVAVIDTGVGLHPDTSMPFSRLTKFVDFVGGLDSPYDDNGHGTAVSGIACGNGLISGGVKRGFSPRAPLVSLKAIGADGSGKTLDILRAMQWLFDNAEEWGVKVCCMSFGAPRSEKDPLSLGAAALWRKGITVVASAGNDGAKGVSSPGSCADVITVGAAQTDGETYKVCDFSGVGDDFTHKPDLVAPGMDVYAPYFKGGYASFSGTSASAPIVAGICSQVLYKYPRFTPDYLKTLLVKSATPNAESVIKRGAGMLNVTKLRSLLADE